MKSNYLNNLEREFYFVTDLEREQIINEYEVHFDERIKDGATEAEVISDLGTPKSVAIEYATELEINYSAAEKLLANTKRDCNIYVKSLKRKMNEIKTEEANKRKNKQQYVKEQNVKSIDLSTDSDYNTIDSSSSLIKRIAKKIGIFLITILYALKTSLGFVIKLFIKFFIFILGITFALIILSLIIAGILLPIFITITTHSFIIWFLIYGSITSAIVFFATISFTCIKYFGRINE